MQETATASFHMAAGNVAEPESYDTNNMISSNGSVGS